MTVKTVPPVQHVPDNTTTQQMRELWITSLYVRASEVQLFTA